MNVRRGFTLVELLVVIGIIAVLIGILLPTLGKARESGRKTICMNNVRQIGIGFLMYADGNKGVLPIDGLDGDATNEPVAKWDDPSLWINAVCQRVFNKSYADFQDAHITGANKLPQSPDNHILVCPSADKAIGNLGTGDSWDPAGYFHLYFTNPTSGSPQRRPTYICYAYNSKLVTAQTSKFKLNQLRPSSEVVLIAEKMMTPDEVKPKFGGSLGRIKASWERVTARHTGGGYFLFADGHVGYLTYKEANTKNPAGGNDFNQPGRIIWNPRQPAF